MSAPTNMELILQHGLSDNGYRLPAMQFELNVTLKARGAYDMRIGVENPPSGAWQPYNPTFMYDFVGPSGGNYTLYAQTRSEALELSNVVSDTITIWGISNTIPRSILVDSSVYYYVKDVLTSAGFVDASGALNINVIQEQLEQHIPQEVAEKLYDGEEVSNESIGLPAVCVTSMINDYKPAALGGSSWEHKMYHLDVYGTSEVESKEIASILEEKLLYGIPVYDYNMGAMPGISGFPLPDQLIGVFHTSDVRSSKLLTPSYSVLSMHRRKISFRVSNIRKTF